jgi:hypothetical protein
MTAVTLAVAFSFHTKVWRMGFSTGLGAGGEVLGGGGEALGGGGFLAGTAAA